MIRFAIFGAVMVLVKDEMSHRGEELTHVRFGGQVNRNVVEVEGKENRDARRSPPPRPGGWRTQTVLAAIGHSERSQSS